MAKAKKRELLVVGQRVFIEVYGGWVSKKERAISEYEIVAVNKTNAYAIDVDRLERYRSDEKKFNYFKERINLKTHEIKIDTLGYSRRLWISEGDFNNSVELQKEKVRLRQQAHDKVNKMSISELRKMLEI